MSDVQQESPNIKHVKKNEAIQHLMQQIKHVEEDIRQSYGEYDHMLMQFQQLQSSRWLAISKLSNWKRTIRHIAAYILGRRNWKRLYSKTYKNKQASNDLKGYVKALYEDGFTSKVVQELETLYVTSPNKYIRRATAWELLFWHANKQTKVGAKQALLYFFAACDQETDVNILIQKILVAAECMVLLGWHNEAQLILNEISKVKQNENIILAKANATNDISERVALINNVFTQYGLERIELKQTEDFPYTRLDAHVTDVIHHEEKVSIIIPTYNAANLIGVAIESLQKQTWQHLEMIVVDDHSTDNTYDIVQQYAKADERIKVFQTPTNSGAYTARNIGLLHATGHYVTVNDADDWSHPRKIEIQVTHLQQHPHIIANTSTLCRVTENLFVYRRGTRGKYLFSNMSSLLFRRKIVQEKLGYWDSVRFAADGEFKKRIISVFGKGAVVDLQTGPLSLPLQSEHSLTANSAFGYHGAFVGARKEYVESFESYHESATDFYYPFPMEARLFPVPKPMEPIYQSSKRQVDVVLIADFDMVTEQDIHMMKKQIKVHQQKGLMTGLVHMAIYNPEKKKRRKDQPFRSLINGNDVQMLVYGEEIKCKVAVIHHCLSLAVVQQHIPKLEALTSLIIVDDSVLKKYNKNKHLELKAIRDNHMHYFNRVGNWFYYDERLKEELEKNRSREVRYLPLRKENWLENDQSYEVLYEKRIDSWDVQQ